MILTSKNNSPSLATSGSHQRRDILEMIALDLPLLQILESVCLKIEHKLSNETLCSIMLFDAETKVFKLAASPSMHESLRNQFKEHVIHLDQWPCGNSIHTGEVHIVENISLIQDTNAPFLLFSQYGIQSCWSLPITNSRHAILGVVALHNPLPKTPSVEEQAIVVDAIRFISIAIDKKNTMQHLAISEDRYRSVVNNLTEGIMVIAPGGKIITCNPSAQKILKISDIQTIGRRHRYFNRILRQDGSCIPFGEDPTSKVIRTGKPINNASLGIELQDGSIVWLVVNAQPIYQSQMPIDEGKHSTEISAVLISFTDISKERETEKKLHYLALHDTLTKLPNRLQFQQRLEHALIYTYNQKVAVFFLDLDHFKNVNDTAGHAAGDALLCEVAKRLSSCIRTSDLLARLGGDEFVVVVESFENIQQLKELAERLLNQMREPFLIEQRQYHLGTSIGIGVYPVDGTDGTSLLKCADSAMYQAKQMGRNNYQFYTSELMIRAQHRYTLEINMRKALVNEEFLVYYQPKVSLETNQIVGAEALIRWKMNELEDLVLPSDFIPYAEDMGLILPIGRWILSRACKQAQIWRQEIYAEFVISVNISPKQFLDENLPQFLQEILLESKLPAHALELEITEGLLMGEEEQIMTTLNEIIQLGVKVSLDDFGTGFSSLSYLQKFPISNIKIDRSFINKIPENRDSIILTRAIMAMSKALGMSVTAEGVENQAQIDFLREAGCNEIQGHFCSAPVSHIEFSVLLSRQNLLQS